MQLYYTDHYAIDLPPGHKFPMRKYRMLRDLLAADAIFNLQPAPLASIATIERVHDPEYVRQFVDGTLSPQAVRRIGFPWSQGMVLRTLASAGSTLSAATTALEHGAGGTLAGGTHHAFRAEGSGFCVFNDLAIAIIHLRETVGIKRAAVIDLDVHQGDGTAQIFEQDPAVLTFSMHGKNNFPFRKQRSRIDIELEDKAGDDEYLRNLEAVLPQVFEFNPGVVFYQSGVDALATDVLGRLSLTPEGMRCRDEIVIRAACKYGAPFIVTLGGGYSNPIERTVEAHAATFRTLHSVYGPSSQRSGT